MTSDVAVMVDVAVPVTLLKVEVEVAVANRVAVVVKDPQIPGIQRPARLRPVVMVWVTTALEVEEVNEVISVDCVIVVVNVVVNRKLGFEKLPGPRPGYTKD